MTDRRDRASGNGDHVVFDSVDEARLGDERFYAYDEHEEHD